MPRNDELGLEFMIWNLVLVSDFGFSASYLDIQFVAFFQNWYDKFNRILIIGCYYYIIICIAIHI